MIKKITLITLCAIAVTQNTFAGSLPDEHAPIGVMGDHTHNKGEWMLSYRYNNMKMDGNRSGTNAVSTANVHQNFMVAPIDMVMQMHMFGIMYGLTDDLTLMTMLPYTELSMNLQTRMGVNFATNAQGIGDVKVGGLYSLYKEGRSNIILNAGLSIPTGSINKSDATPMGPNIPLPYPMQVGSGTFDIQPGLTYTSGKDSWSWGAQINSNIRTGTNDTGYKLGNQYGFTMWGARRLNDAFSISVRSEIKTIGDIKGADAALNPMMVPTARTDLRHGERVDIFAGVNFIVPSGSLEGNRLAVEFSAPVYQNLDGPQLETDYRITAGWQLAF